MSPVEHLGKGAVWSVAAMVAAHYGAASTATMLVGFSLADLVMAAYRSRWPA